MFLTLVTQGFALFALLFCLVAFAARWHWTESRPLAVDRSEPKGSPQSGVVYAFTLGMSPLAKESTRRHMLAYLRGVGFHVGIFAGLGALAVSPWWSLLPQPLIGLLAALIGLGAVLGLIGEIMRQVEHNLKALSTLDDHAAVLLVTFWLAATGAALVNTAWLPAMYLTAAAMLVYAPLGKIRHCLYFFFSRLFFGRFVGRRAAVQVEH